MNLLLDKLPQTIVVNGLEYPIKTNFRDWIRFETVMLSETEQKAKIQTFVDIMNGAIPENFSSAVDAVIQFYQCGEQSSGKGGNIVNKRIYDYEKDQFLIYTAFLQCYHIDLNRTDYMHWWQFKQMFLELPDECKMKKVMMYRSININSKMSAEQKKYYAEMKRIYALPSMSTEAKARSFGAVLASGMHIKEP